jgi:hypothetical protein
MQARLGGQGQLVLLQVLQGLYRHYKGGVQVLLVLPQQQQQQVLPSLLALLLSALRMKRARRKGFTWMAAWMLILIALAATQRMMEIRSGEASMRRTTR